MIGLPNVSLLFKKEEEKTGGCAKKECALGVTMLRMGTKTLAKEKGALSFVSTKQMNKLN